MPKTQVEMIVDEMIKHTGTPMLLPGVRKQIENMVETLLSEGFQIIPPGTTPPVGGRSSRTCAARMCTETAVHFGSTGPWCQGHFHLAGDSFVPIDHTSFFCPGCGTHKPPYGMTGAEGDVKGFGHVGYMTIFCGVDSCRRILQVVVLGMTPEGKIQ